MNVSHQSPILLTESTVPPFTLAQQTQSASVEESPAQSSPDPNGVALFSTGLFLVPFCLLMVWAIALFFVAEFWQDKRQAAPGSEASQLSPCRNCQFFSNSAYLRCTVHPSTVLTPAAQDCADYTAIDEDS